MIINVQPRDLPSPNIGVQIANNAASYIDIVGTNPVLTSTAPKFPMPRQSRIQQLPSYITTALVSQQALTNNTLSAAEKIKNGIISSTTGATLSQLSLPGQLVKPGAGQFLQQLQQQAPSLSFNKLASNTLMTGNFGVTNAQSLVKNVSAQVNATANSLINSTIGLTKNNIINGTESPTQVAGVILAGATLGVNKVTELLSTPAAVVSKITDSVNSFGKLVSGGNFAAGLADKVSGGLSGLTSSISGLTSGLSSSIGGITAGITGSIGSLTSGLTAGISGLTSGLTSGITGALGGITGSLGGITGALGGITGALGGIAGALGGLFGGGSKRVVQIPSVPLVRSFIPGIASSAQQAYKIAETSFGNLEANKPNALGGAKLPTSESTSNSLLLMRKLDVAREELSNAEQELAQANRAYRIEESAEVYSSLLKAQSNVAIAEQKLKQIEKSISTNPISTNTNIYNIASAQNITTAAYATVTGLINSPNTNNSGINSLPGGLGVFASQVSGTASNIINSIKGTAEKVTSSVNSVVNTLKDPSKLVGNLIGNVQQKIGSLASGASSIFNSVKTSFGGLMGSISSTISSIGSSPGQIKPATLATNTFDAITAQTSKIGMIISDPRIPVPVFKEATPTVDADVVQEQQVAAQQQLEILYSERDLLSYNIGLLGAQYVENQEASLISQIDSLNKQLSSIDAKIAAAQVNYERILTNS